MIGILYPRSILKRLMNGKPSFEKPSFYLEAAKDAGEEIVFFTLADIHWKKEKIWGWNGAKRFRVKQPLPLVIINRTRSNDFYTKDRIRRLKQLGRIVFNEHNVVSKLDIHHILSQNRRLLPYLPMTDAASSSKVSELLQQTPTLFLKPRTASVGTGIIRVRKVNDDTFAEINVLGKTKRTKVSVPQIMSIVKRRKRGYLVQQGITLMEYKGKPVDFRVSIQKDGRGRWQYTGMVGKVARKGSIVTNLHCGGKSLKAGELFEHWGWDGPKLEGKIARLGLRIAKSLDERLPHLADLGLDIALDEQQHPWFIEANLRDLRVTFRNAGEKTKWRATFANPVHYAVYLNRQLKEAMQQKEAAEEQDNREEKHKDEAPLGEELA